MATIKKKIYSVSFYYKGSPIPYHTITCCDWEAVKDYRHRAKLLGEKITYEQTGTRTERTTRPVW